MDLGKIQVSSPVVHPPPFDSTSWLWMDLLFLSRCNVAVKQQQFMMYSLDLHIINTDIGCQKYYPIKYITHMMSLSTWMILWLEFKDWKPEYENRWFTVNTTSSTYSTWCHLISDATTWHFVFLCLLCHFTLLRETDFYMPAQSKPFTV